MTNQLTNPTGLPVIHDCAAGIDIGHDFMSLAYILIIYDEPVQTFQAFTSDIERMANWLESMGIRLVARKPG